MAISPYLSTKLRRLSLLTMVSVVMVHAFNFENRFLFPGRIFSESLDFNTGFQVFFSHGLLRFGIPLFFLRAGYLLAASAEKYAFPDLVAKRFRSLVLPFLLYSLLGMLVVFGLEMTDFGSALLNRVPLRAFGNKPLHEMGLFEKAVVWILAPVPFQLWFLRVLFLLSLSYPLISWGLKRFPWLILASFGCLWAISWDSRLVNGVGLFFFSLGMWAQANPRFGLENTTWIPALRLDIWLLPLLVFSTFLSFQSYSWAPLVLKVTYKIQQLGLLAGLWLGYDRWIGKRQNLDWVDRITRYNFFVYGLHVPALFLLSEGLLLALGRSPETGLAVYLVSGFGVILLSILAGKAVERLSPSLFGWMTGGRS